MNTYITPGKIRHLIILCLCISGLYGREPKWPKFKLYTTANTGRADEFYEGQDLPRSFNWRHKTIFIVHGFNPLGIPDMDWMDDMKNAILEQGDHNVILVDWKRGAGSIEQLVRDEIPFLHEGFRFRRDLGDELFNLFEGLTRGFQSGVSLYTDAAQSARYTGEQIADVFWRNRLRTSDARCVGHSLGAHACGFAGKSLRGELEEIVGLDPAGPGFSDKAPDQRLDARDAQFVQVIHTDCVSRLFGANLPLGMAKAIGHVDFYPNGGGNQPGCKSKDLACNHERATLLYTASIRADCFRAVPCSSTRAATSGRCRSSCPRSGCQLMGWKVNPDGPHGPHWLRTTSRHPFCVP